MLFGKKIPIYSYDIVREGEDTVMRVNYEQAPIVPSLEELLSPQGSIVTVDNSLIVKDNNWVIEQIRKKIEELEIPYWHPIKKIPEGDKTGEPRNIGITHVHQFYNKRNQ